MQTLPKTLVQDLTTSINTSFDCLMQYGVVKSGRRFRYLTFGDYFIKISSCSFGANKLMNEWRATRIAMDLKLPVVKAVSVSAKHETIRFIIYERLPINTGATFETASQIASAAANIGSQCFNTINRVTGVPIEQDIANQLTEVHFCSANAQRFRATADEIIMIIHRLTTGLSRAVYIRNRVEQLFKILHTTIQAEEQRLTGHYFVHNDVALRNLFLPQHGEAGLMFDLEWAGISSSQTLARLVDFGSCYARLASNPSAQFNFLQALRAQFCTEFATHCCDFGSLYELRWIMKAPSPDFRQARRILEELA